jgi:hypothetical protein
MSDLEMSDQEMSDQEKTVSLACLAALAAVERWYPTFASFCKEGRRRGRASTVLHPLV